MSPLFLNGKDICNIVKRFFAILGIVLVSFSAFHSSFVDCVSEKELEMIKIRLYLGENSTDNYRDASVGDTETLAESMNLTKPSVIYIHGFTENLDRKSVHTIIDAHLKVDKENVMAIDFAEIAAQDYISVAISAPHVGRRIAKAIDGLVESGLNPGEIHVVGHSMGAQIAGYVGRNVASKVSRITGLDPAGPLFYEVLDHLTSKDAEFVVVIHTDAGFYGNAITSGGGADFWVNGGTRVQPGCPVFSVPYSDDEFCSHHRSYDYYAESVVNEESFIGVRCDNWWKFKSNSCKNNKKVPMGYGTPNGTKGSFYLDTKRTMPFGRGKHSVEPVLNFW